MRLLLVTNDYPPRPGGIQQYLANLVMAFPGEVRVLGPRDAAAGPEEGVARSRSRFMWPTPSITRWVRAEAEAFQPDAILFGAPYPLPYMIKALKPDLDIPIGVMCHGAEVTIPSAIPVARGLLVRSLRRADVLFAVSNFTASKVAALTRRPVTYAGGAVDVASFGAAGPGGGADAVIGCVSRFVPRKRQDVLIDAVAELHGRGHRVELLLVGKGRLEARLRRRAARAGINVRFDIDVPWAELPARYGEMNIFCMPCRSRWGGLEVEGLGLVFLEAAAARLPVLAGTSGGAPETVVPGVTGYVVHDQNAIVEAVELLLSDPDAAAAMGNAGRERVEAEFTWSRVVDRIVSGFRESH